ncbi:MAG: response regulator [Deltaproteobacteria bacterium]|nr:response regulator [Deltaproteobacteria bacterium]
MSQIKILVAEDDMNIRMGLVDTLESEDYRVVEAKDGRQALELFKTDSFDLVLLDIMMPGSGSCFTARIKHHESD